MEIDFNKAENTETSEFVNFSIRAYVAEIRKKDWKKCWPFGSLGDPDIKDEVFASYRFPECGFSSSQNCPVGIDDTPEHTEACDSSKADIFSGKEDRYETTTDMTESLRIDDNTGRTIHDGSIELSSSKVNKARCQQQNSINHGSSVDDPERNRPRKKPQKFLSLSDILRDLAGPSGGCHVRYDHTTNPDNVNSRFATETTEDESDDMTLDAFFRKQKGVQVAPMLKKMRKMQVQAEDSLGNDSDISQSRKDDGDTQPMAKHKKSSADDRPLPCRDISNGYLQVHDTEIANEDSEMEAVMLLASHFSDENPSTPQTVESGTRRENKETAMACACVQKKIRKITPASATKDPHKKVAKEEVEIYSAVCSMNRNPADSSIPDAENKFMRGG